MPDCINVEAIMKTWGLYFGILLAFRVGLSAQSGWNIQQISNTPHGFYTGHSSVSDSKVLTIPDFDYSCMPSYWDETPSYSEISCSDNGVLNLVGTYNVNELFPNPGIICQTGNLLLLANGYGVYKYQLATNSTPQYLGVFSSPVEYDDYGPPDFNDSRAEAFLLLGNEAVINFYKEVVWNSDEENEIIWEFYTLETYTISDNGAFTFLNSREIDYSQNGPFRADDSGFLNICGTTYQYVPSANVPALPSCNLPVSLNNCAVDNHTLIAITDTGLAVFNFDDLTKTLSLTGQYTSTDWNEGVQIALSQTVAFVAAGNNGLIAFDISDPGSIQEIFRIAEYGPAQKVTIYDSLLYMTTSEGLYKYSIVDSYNPLLLSSLPQTGMMKSVAVMNDKLFTLSARGILTIYDISTPEIPTPIGATDLAGETYLDIAVQDTLVYTLDQTSGLHVVDISDLANPSQISQLDLDPARKFACVGVDGGKLVVGGRGYFQVVDVSDPSNPVLRGSDPTNDGILWPYSKIIVDGDQAVSVRFNRTSNQSGWLKTHDISDPDNPVIVGVLNLFDAAYGLGIKDHYAFTVESFYSYCLDVIDIGDPQHPTLAAQLDLPQTAQPVSLTVEGDFAYICYSSTGLLVVNISNPLSPYLCGSYDTPGVALKVAVKDNIAYIADEGFLGVYDCTDAQSTGPVAKTDQSAAPSVLALDPCCPNPFNPSTILSYSLPSETDVRLEVYNIRGQRVANLVDKRQSAGIHHVVWNGCGSNDEALGSGVYLIRFSADGAFLTRKVTLLK
jgi:hypothetical protein